MRIFRLMLVVALATLAGSCIRKEPLNAECDIMAAILDGDVLNRVPIIENNKVIIYVKNGVSVKALAPEFVLTPGASIEPASGTARDFSSPQTYMTSSEDGKWHKVYTVEVRRNSSNLEFNFENVRTVSALMGACSYDVFYEIGANGAESLAWASGNAGFALTLQGTTPSTFPTFQSDNGWTGKCVEMVTRATGSFGESVKKPLAAGNLFLGKFDMNNAVNKPLESTQFGTPFINVPLSLSGYYKYRPGETYCRMNSTTGKLEPVDGKTDECNIYAVFFEVTDNMEWLDGTNVMAEDNPNILAVARLSPDQRGHTPEWSEFNLPFVYREGKTVDPEKLAEGKYSITIVFSSSIDGDYFSGAIGSTLLVDEVFISCQNQ